MAKQRPLDDALYAMAETSNDAELMDRMAQQDRSPVSTDRSLPRFAIVVGPSPFTMPRGWEYYLTTPFEGVSYIATVAHNAGYPTRIIDVRFAADPLRAAYEQVLEGTDILGVATFEDNFPFVRDLMRLVREARPDIPIICGGSLVTSAPQVFMDHTDMDVAVISEGELTIQELLASYALDRWDTDLPRIRGIWYRGSEGEVCKTLPRGQMRNLDSLPRMQLDLWPQAHGPLGMQPQIITSFSRGCRFDCSFCYRTTPTVAAKSPQKFHDELTWLKERWGTEFLFMADLTFNADKRQCIEMSEAIGDHGMRFTCMCRCAEAEEERLAAMARSGCDVILYGVESLGAAALKEAHKPTTENVSLRAMKRTLDAGIRFGSLLIVGLQGETEEGLEYMASWAESHHHVVRVKYLQALPGTPVYRDMLSRGLIKSEVAHLEWLSTEQSLYEDEFLNINGLPEAAMRRAYQRIYDAYQPGPVMDFRHWPKNFQYIKPNPDSGAQHSVDYAGADWRKRFSSAGGVLTPGTERYTLDRTGPPGAVEAGATLASCGAKRLALA